MNNKEPKKRVPLQLEDILFRLFIVIIPFIGLMLVIFGLILRLLDLRESSAVIFIGVLSAVLPWAGAAALNPIIKKRALKKHEIEEKKFFDGNFGDTGADYEFFRHPFLTLWGKKYDITVFFHNAEDCITAEQKDAYLDFISRLAQNERDIECVIERYYSDKYGRYDAKIIAESFLADSIQVSCDGEYVFLCTDEKTDYDIAISFLPEPRLMSADEWFDQKEKERPRVSGE